jgi:hypothetical protein
MKKTLVILALLLVFLMTAICDPIFRDNLAFYYNERNNGYTVYGVDSTAISITIPSEINGISIVAIGEDAFKDFTSLNKVIIPGSVTSISDSAFYGCKELTSISIPDGVSIIRRNTFSGCSSLRTVIIPNTVTSIENNAFYDCAKLSYIEIPESVTYIGKRAFQNCESLKSIIIPDKTTSVEEYTFAGCTKLEDVILSKNTISIGECAFKNCKSLTSIEIPENVKTIGEYAFAISTSTVISSSINLYGSNSSSQQSTSSTGLTSITISGAIKQINKTAFAGCKNLAIKYGSTKEMWATVFVEIKKEKSTNQYYWVPSTEKYDNTKYTVFCSDGIIRD